MCNGLEVSRQSKQPSLKTGLSKGEAIELTLEKDSAVRFSKVNILRPLAIEADKGSCRLAFGITSYSHGVGRQDAWGVLVPSEYLGTRLWLRPCWMKEQERTRNEWW